MPRSRTPTTKSDIQLSARVTIGTPSIPSAIGSMNRAAPVSNTKPQQNTAPSQTRANGIGIGPASCKGISLNINDIHQPMPTRKFSPEVDLYPWSDIAVGMAKSLDVIFTALSDATRRDILMMLLEDDMAVTDVAEPFEMSLAAVSKHLTILSRAGLISQEKRGRVKWCKLEPDALKDASIWMQSFGQFEAVNLDAFERFLEQELPAASSDPPGLSQREESRKA